jgi:hypothetical protein
MGLLWLHRKGMATSFATYWPTGSIKERPVEAMPGCAVEKNPAG